MLASVRENSIFPSGFSLQSPRGRYDYIDDITGIQVGTCS